MSNISSKRERKKEFTTGNIIGKILVKEITFDFGVYYPLVHTTCFYNGQRVMSITKLALLGE